MPATAAPNILQMGVSVDVTAANTDLQSVIQRLKALEDQTKRTSGSQEHGVSSMQATSAALRTLEGGFTNNLRAAERFLTLIPGLSDGLKNIFPVVGAIAFGGALLELVEHAFKLYEALRQVQEAPHRINEAFAQMNDQMQVSNDELRVQNDRLDMQIAKLQGRPGNGLKTALDEARLAADQLADSLNKDLEGIEKILNDKDNSIGAFKGFFTGAAPTTQITEQFKQFRSQMAQISVDTAAQLSKVSDPQEQTAIFQQATHQRMEAIRSETKVLMDQLKVAQQLQATRESEIKNSRQIDTATPYGNVVTKTSTNIADQSAKIANYQGMIQNLTRETERNALEQENAVKKGQEAQLEAVKQATDQRREIEQNAAHELARSLEGEMQGMGRFAEQFISQIEAMHQKGVTSFKAFSDYMKAMQNNMATEQRKQAATIVKDQQEGLMTALEEQGKGFTQNNDYQNEVIQRQQEIANRTLGIQEQSLSQSKDLQMKALDALDARTVGQKLSVEQRKLAIEMDYLQKSQALQAARINADAEQQLADAEVRAQKQLLSAGDDQDSQNRVNQAWANEQMAINQGRNADLGALQGRTSAQAQEAQMQAAKASTQVVQEQYKSVYDAILRQTDDFLDAVEEHTGSAWKRIADNLKKTFLDAFNNLISSQIAGTFASAITGLQQNGQSGKRGGFAMGNPAGMLGGMVPMPSLGPGGTAPFIGSNFSNAYSDRSASYPSMGGGMPAAGPSITAPPAAVSGMSSLDPDTASTFGAALSMGAGDRDLAAILQSSGYDPKQFGLPNADGVSQGMPAMIGPGGTAGTFSGPVSMGGTAQQNPLGGLLSGGIFSRLGGAGGWSKLLQSGILAAGGTMLMSGAMNPRMSGTFGGTAKTIGGAAMTGYGLASKYMPPGFGPMGALAGAGLGMVVNGSERGSFAGTLESTAGGALSGAEIGAAIGMFGGPIGMGMGALIGAGVGLVSGLVGMFTGNETDHVKSIVKKAYGVSISTDMAQSIINISKQSFGGSDTVAINSPQVRQMLQMYAQATGQGNGSRINPQPVPYTFASAGGSVSNVSAMLDGQSSASYGGIVPTISPFVMPGTPGVPGLSNASNGPVLLQLNGQATTQLLNGQIATAAPQAVINGAQSQRTGNAMLASMYQPGLVTTS